MTDYPIELPPIYTFRVPFWHYLPIALLLLLWKHNSRVVFTDCVIAKTFAIFEREKTNQSTLL